MKEAIESGDLQIVSSLLQAGFDINKKDDENLTPLHRAVINNRAEIVEHLIEKDADVDAKGGLMRTNVGLQRNIDYTALHAAVENEHLNIVKILVNKGGANLFLRNFNRENAFIIARLKNNQPIRRFLCSKHPLYCSCKTSILPWMGLALVLHLLSITGIVIIMFDHLYIQVHQFIFC